MDSSNTINYAAILASLSQSHDPESKAEKEQLYARCIEYAREHLAGTYDHNPFLAYAADRLGQVPVRMNAPGPRVEETGQERLHLTHTTFNGVEITGNPSGLHYLAALLQSLAQARLNGEHQHLYAGEAPLHGQSYGLTVYLEDDAWFEQHASEENPEPANPEPTADLPERRLLAPEAIVAFAWVHPQPSPGTVPGKIYRVLSYRKNKRQDESDQTYFFEVRGEEGDQVSVFADLAGDDFLFFTENDLEQVRS